MDNSNPSDKTNSANKGISVRILDKEFLIGCPKNAESTLRASASYLDEQMRKIRKSGRIVGTERIAVMAALNICHELITLQNSPKTEAVDGLKERLHALSQKIDYALADNLSDVKTDSRKMPEFETE